MRAQKYVIKFTYILRTQSARSAAVQHMLLSVHNNQALPARPRGSASGRTWYLCSNQNTYQFRLAHRKCGMQNKDMCETHSSLLENHHNWALCSRLSRYRRIFGFFRND